MTRIEILTIGDELVEGRLVDSNSALMAEQLGEAGLTVTRMVSVGDDLPAIVGALRDATARAEAVLVSGGLGPTTDDITAAAAAQALGVPLERYPEALEHTRCFFTSRGRPMPPSNEKQADLPSGAVLLPNPWGTAVGFRAHADGCCLYFMPGVPRELAGILRESVIPHLRSFLRCEAPHLATLKVFGLGESEVGDRLEGLGADLPEGASLKIQYRATFPEIHVRLVLTGLDGAAARETLARLAAAASGRLGHHVFASGGARLDTTYAEVVVASLARRGATFAVVETCTEGLVSELALGAPAGATVHRGGLIAGDPYGALEALGLPQRPAPASWGALSRDLAEAVRSRYGTILGLASAGSPDPSPLGRAGDLCLALAGPDGTELRELCYPIDRERFRVLAAHAALSRLRSWAR